VVADDADRPNIDHRAEQVVGDRGAQYRRPAAQPGGLWCTGRGDQAQKRHRREHADQVLVDGEHIADRHRRPGGDPDHKCGGAHTDEEERDQALQGADQQDTDHGAGQREGTGDQGGRRYRCRDADTEDHTAE